LKKAYILLALMAAGTSCAQARPVAGIGLDAGLVASRMNDPIAGSYQSNGLSAGLDYQFAVSDSFSINPFLMTSFEAATGGNLQSGTRATHDNIGLELRYWINNAFVGGHLFSQTEVLAHTVGNVTTSTTASGGGLGLVGGWEDPDSGVFVMGQLDGVRVHYPTSTTKVSEVRLSIGYRWK
jgi:opacity protein-like surface antigen